VSVTKAITRILHADLVVVDDTGPPPASPDASEGLYRLAQRLLALNAAIWRTR
jgi:hypothetical protein